MFIVTATIKTAGCKLVTGNEDGSKPYTFLATNLKITFEEGSLQLSISEME
jgi:hypothetical protein